MATQPTPFKGAAPHPTCQKIVEFQLHHSLGVLGTTTMPLEVTPSASDGIRRLKERLSGLETEEGRMKGLNFVPKKDDVFVVTSPKCGTTWVQQIMHGLRTRGSMDFEEIALVIPCLEMAHDYGYRDLDAPQPGHHRMYKTHFWYPHCPKGARYIYVIRDPADVAPSFFRFFEGWMFEPGELTLDEFTTEFLLARGAPASSMQNASIWQHLLSWWPHRADKDVLWLHYEDLQQDLRQCVSLIADFLGAPAAGDDALIDLVTQQASLEFMQLHHTKYEERPLKMARNPACGLPLDAGLGDAASGKVRTKARAPVSKELSSALQLRWKQEVEPVTGFTSYSQMRAAVNLELGRPFV